MTGVVRLADGSAAVGRIVVAFWSGLRKEQRLGETRSDRDGRYQISYADRTARGGLVVKILDAKRGVLATSPVSFESRPIAVVDVTIPADVETPPSQFETVARALEQLLEGVAISQLEEDSRHHDLTFLAGETGLDKTVVGRFVLAHRLAQKGLPAELWFVLLGGAFFQWADGRSVREQQETVTTALPSLDAAAVRKAVLRGLDSREISAAFEKQMPAWSEAFSAFVARLTLGAPDQPTFLQSALEQAGVRTTAKREAVARLLGERRGLTDDVAAALERDRTLTRAQVVDLQTSFRLADLTGGAFDVVAMVKERFKVSEPGAISTLASHAEEEWVRLVRATHEAGKIKLPGDVVDVGAGPSFPAAEVFGRSLARRVRDAFPTIAFAGDLGRGLAQGGARGLRHGKTFAGFLARHPAFDLLSTAVDPFFDALTAPADEAAAGDASFRAEVKAVQRVFKLAPSFDAVDALLTDDLHSAQQLYRLGESAFVRKYAGAPGFSEEGARRTWRRAADTHAAVLTIVADLKALDSDAVPAVLANGSAALSTFPNWDTLFKTGDLCECEHCNSVLGPAAHFADLLRFLGDRASLSPGVTVKDVLLARRPDLAHIELGCENALTPLPYVDVVCEVLERVVSAGANDSELLGFTAMPTDPLAAQAAVAVALDAAGLPVGATFSLSQISPTDPERWVVHGEDATYLLEKKATPNFFARVLPNTKASAEEVRAYPQYVDPQAYELLRHARHAFVLPFDLFGEEVRAAFAKSNVRRWEIMQSLRGVAPPNDATDGDVAAEYFGISCDAAVPIDEKGLILIADATVAGQQAAWGEIGNAAWLDAVSNVKTFLGKTRLEYEELGALLDLPFINPDGDVFIRHLDPSCDTAEKVIEGLDPAVLDRVHRFLRLWRKLGGWKLWELDAALRCPGVGGGTLDETALIKLFYFARLRGRLGAKASVAAVCALFEDLETEMHFVQFLEKRADGLYQSVFLDKRLVQPLDPAFAVAAVDVPGPTTEKISGHRPTILSALGVSPTDLDQLIGLVRFSDGQPYINDDLTLANLSFLWRHAWIGKALKLKVDDWRKGLALLQQDVPTFGDARAAWALIERLDRLKASGFSVDELDWILDADRAARAAAKEPASARFLSALRAELRAARAQFDPASFPFLEPPGDLDRLAGLLITLLQQLHRNEAEARRFVDCLRDEVRTEAAVTGMPLNFIFPVVITSAIRVRYDEAAQMLRFVGLMTPAERATLLGSPALAAVTGLPSYQAAVAALFDEPRLALKFLDPIFTAPLEALPASLPPALAGKVSFDADARLLRTVGILSAEEKALLDAVSAAPAYRAAVDSLFAQPATGTFPPDLLWLDDAVLLFPLRDPDDAANDNLALNLKTAVTKGLAYLSRSTSESLVVRAAAAQLGLTEALTRRLLADYAILPETLLAHLTGPFADTDGVVDRATLPSTFDGWEWAVRVAALWKTWKLSLQEWEHLRTLAAGAGVLDFADLPLTSAAPPVPVGTFLQTSRLLRLRDALPEPELSFLELLVRLDAGQLTSAAAFVAAVERVNDRRCAWT